MFGKKKFWKVLRELKQKLKRTDSTRKHTGERIGREDIPEGTKTTIHRKRLQKNKHK